MTPRVRLLVIYSGILLFCAFVLVGQLYVDLQPEPSLPLIRAIATLETTDNSGGNLRGALRFALPNGTTPLVWADLSEEHAQLETGQQVGALLRWSDAEFEVLEVARFALAADPAIP